MNNHSFTDEQLLNLVNNTIESKTEFNQSDFTGGSVQITSTNEHQLIKYKVSLFFGYKNRNPISRTIDINEDLVSIWQMAILTKVKNLQISNNGMNYSELNSLMNSSPRSSSNKVEVVSNKVVSKGSTNIVRTSYEDKKEVTPRMCIDLYRELICSDFAYIREQTSFNHLALLKDDLDKIEKGIRNFALSNTGLTYSLPNFLKDKIYLDYQEVKESKQNQPQQFKSKSDEVAYWIDMHNQDLGLNSEEKIIESEIL